MREEERGFILKKTDIYDYQIDLFLCVRALFLYPAGKVTKYIYTNTVLE